MSSKNTQNLSVNAGQLEAMQLRFEGYSANEISQRLKNVGYDVPQTTIEYWFRKTGPLHEIYREWVEEEKFVRLEQARDMYSAHADKSMRVLLALMTDPNPMIRLMSAREVQTRLFGDPKKRTFAEKDSNDADNAVVKILKEYKVLEENGEFTGDKNNKIAEGSG